MSTLLIDNYDSFTWNVYQYLSQLGAKVQVYRNDKITLQECIKLKPRNIVISPGPGHPSDAGVSNDVIRHFAGIVPILGVCLGEQAMFEVFGGTVTYAGELIHGKTSPITHDGKGLFEGVDQGIQITRYHSLAGDPKTLPDVLEVTSTTESGIIMGIRHKKYVLEGVQFHPESVASEQGHKMFANFLKWEGGTWDKLVLRNDLIKAPPLPRSSSHKIGSGLSLQDASKMNSTSAPDKKESILETIRKQRVLDVNQAKAVEGQSAAHLEQCIALGLPPSLIDFYKRLIECAHPLAVLAEVKRASPSKGNIDLNADAPTQALNYATSGVSAISVLTEPKWFKGSLNDMLRVRQALERFGDDRPAVLRKDFIIDAYQILEARCFGADTILLIVAILSDIDLKYLLNFSRKLGMEPLVEVANEAEMKRALASGAKVIGVNNRDLHTFTVDKTRTSQLSSLVPSDVFLIALSGITSRQDSQHYYDIGARGVLVGEALMKTEDPRMLIRDLRLLKSERKSETSFNRPMVKICGLTRPEDALVAAENGADFLGLIFASSPRQVDISKASVIVNAVRSHWPVSTKDQFLKTMPGSGKDLTWFRKEAQRLEKYTQRRSLPLIIGIFSNTSHLEINAAVRECGLDMVQLHGDETPLDARLISVPVIKVLHVMEGSTVSDLLSQAQAFAGSASFILLDTGIKEMKQQGGSGKQFDLSIAKKIGKTIPLIVAGGLNPGNVKESVGSCSPWAIDVSSGLEKEKGIKDHDKMAKFMTSLGKMKATSVDGPSQKKPKTKE